jgi:hypothetical protein
MVGKGQQSKEWCQGQKKGEGQAAMHKPISRKAPEESSAWSKPPWLWAEGSRDRCGGDKEALEIALSSSYIC